MPIHTMVPQNFTASTHGHSLNAQPHKSAGQSIHSPSNYTGTESEHPEKTFADLILLSQCSTAITQPT